MDHINNMPERVEPLAASFATRISSLEKLVVDHEAQALKRAVQFGRTQGDQDAAVRNVVEQAARNNAKREADDYRRKLVAESERERTDRLRAITKLGEEAAALAPMYENPVQVLSREGLGTPERTHYQSQLQHAGPRELQNYANWAVHNGDRTLAAAVLGRLDTLPRDQRPFAAADFANRVLGEEFTRTRQAIERVRLAVQSAVNANRAFERGRVDSLAKIDIGLARRRVG